MKTRMFLLAAFIAAVMLGGLSHGAFAKGGGGGSKVLITLSASASYPQATGTAAYKAKAGEQEFEAQVQRIKRLTGKKVTFFVNGTKVGSAVVDALGKAHLNLNSQLGNTVPNITAGAVLQARDPNGVVIASGTF